MAKSMQLTTRVRIDLPQVVERATCRGQHNPHADSACANKYHGRENKPSDPQMANDSPVEEQHVHLERPDKPNVCVPANLEETKMLVSISLSVDAL